MTRSCAHCSQRPPFGPSKSSVPTSVFLGDAESPEDPRRRAPTWWFPARACELVCTARCFRPPNPLASHTSWNSPSPSARLLDASSALSADPVMERLPPSPAPLFPCGCGCTTRTAPSPACRPSEPHGASQTERGRPQSTSLLGSPGAWHTTGVPSATANALELLPCIHLPTYGFTVSFISHQACTEYSLYAKSRRQ